MARKPVEASTDASKACDRRRQRLNTDQLSLQQIGADPNNVLDIVLTKQGRRKRVSLAVRTNQDKARDVSENDVVGPPSAAALRGVPHNFSPTCRCNLADRWAFAGDQ